MTQSKQDAYRGRAVVPADPPADDPAPGAVPPRTTPPRTTAGRSTLAWFRSRWPRLAVILGSVLAIVSGLIIAGRFVVDLATSSVPQLTIDTKNNEAVVQGTPLVGEMNILLVGLDNGQATGGELRTDAAHSDSMMILHVSAAHDQGYLSPSPATCG